MFKEEAVRLIRTKWRKIQPFAEELFSIFNSETALETDRRLTVVQKDDTDPLAVRRGAPGQPGTTTITVGDGGVTTTTINNDGGTTTFNYGDHGVTKTTADPAGNVTSTINLLDPNGNTTGNSNGTTGTTGTTGAAGGTGADGTNGTDGQTGGASDLETGRVTGPLMLHGVVRSGSSDSYQVDAYRGPPSTTAATTVTARAANLLPTETIPAGTEMPVLVYFRRGVAAEAILYPAVWLDPE